MQQPPLASRIEVDLYRLLRRCEHRARSEPEEELQKDPKFHHCIAYLRELYSELVEADAFTSPAEWKSTHRMSPEEAATWYASKISALASIIDHHPLPDLWEWPEFIPPPTKRAPAQRSGSAEPWAPDEEDEEERREALLGLQAALLRDTGDGHGGAAAVATAPREAGAAPSASLHRRKRPLPPAPSSCSAAASLEDSARSAISAHRQIQEDLSERMLELAARLRANSMAMQQSVEASSKVFEDGEVALERNVVSVKRVNKRADSLYRRGFFTGCWTWAVMAVLILAFLGMLVVIRLT